MHKSFCGFRSFMLDFADFDNWWTVDRGPITSTKELMFYVIPGVCPSICLSFFPSVQQLRAKTTDHIFMKILKF